MTHEERVYHHMYETMEGIAEQSERIASLEELVLDMWRDLQKQLMPPWSGEYEQRMRELGVEVDDA